MTSDYALSGDYGDQMSLMSDVPEAGECYRNPNSGYIVTVTEVRQSRGVIVCYRNNGSISSTPLATFLANWKPCRPDGTFR